MKIVPFTLDHGMLLQGLTLEDTSVLSRNTMKYWISHGISRSGIHNGRLVGCSGVFHLHAGVGQAWMLTHSTRVKQCPVSFMRAVGDGLTCSFKAMKLHRIQAIVECNLLEANDFVSSLGFVREGMLWEYGRDKKDYYMYSLLRRHALCDI